MGKRVHVIKRQPQYGDTEAFNWATEEFREFLSGLGCNMCGEEYSDSFECLKKEYKKVLNIVKECAENGKSAKVKRFLKNQDCDMEEFDSYIEALGGDIKHIAKSMQAFFDEADKKSGWISFVAW